MAFAHQFIYGWFVGQSVRPEDCRRLAYASLELSAVRPQYNIDFYFYGFHTSCLLMFILHMFEMCFGTMPKELLLCIYYTII